MDKCDKVLIEILKASMNKKKYALNDNNIEMDELIKEAQDHKISSLVYYTLDRSVFDLIKPNILKEWKQEVIVSNLIEIKHDKDIVNIVNDFNENNIKYICLKGIYLKDLYPKRELRTMSDADILVHKNDYDRAKEILLKQGYNCDEYGNSIHEVLNKNRCIEVELHNALIDKDVIDIKYEKFEKNIWENTIEYKYNNTHSMILGKNDFLFHLLFHMIVHAKFMGFGIRQLYDLCLYIKHNKSEINWVEFYKKADECNIIEFSKAILYIIYEIFGVCADESLIKDIKFSKQDIYFLLDNILESGVYGKKNLQDDFKFLYKNDEFHRTDEGILKNILNFTFPNIKFMGERYNYAKKFKILIPIAWIHRIIFGGLIKNKIFYNIKNVIYSIKIRKSRNRLIKVFKIPR